MYDSRLNRNHFDQIPMFVSAAFISLLDNYESDTGEPEIVTPEEVAENHKFLDSIIQTPTMKVPATECSVITQSVLQMTKTVRGVMKVSRV